MSLRCDEPLRIHLSSCKQRLEDSRILTALACFLLDPRQVWEPLCYTADLFVTFLIVANIFLVLRQRRWRPRDQPGERRLQVCADSPQAFFSAI